MKKSRFSEEQIIGILREADSGSSVKAVCAQHNLSAATYYTWKRKYGGMDVAEARRLRSLEEENSRLKRLIADYAVQIQILKEVNSKKVVGPSSKRRAVKAVIEQGVGTTAQACRALGLARSSYYRSRAMSQESRNLQKTDRPSQPGTSALRVTALLRRSGYEINGKRVQRVRRKEGLQVSRRQRKLRRVGLSTAERQRAARVNHVWSWDFVEDQTENGTRFRVLTLIDEHTRENLAMHAGWSIRAVDVITVVEAAMARYGAPTHLRSDNGPELIAYAIQDWLREKNVKTIYITPGSPWENAYIESFHDKLRDECLNR